MQTSKLVNHTWLPVSELEGYKFHYLTAELHESYTGPGGTEESWTNDAEPIAVVVEAPNGKTLTKLLASRHERDEDKPTPLNEHCTNLDEAKAYIFAALRIK